MVISPLQNSLAKFVNIVKENYNSSNPLNFIKFLDEKDVNFKLQLKQNKSTPSPFSYKGHTFIFFQYELKVLFR